MSALSKLTLVVGNKPSGSSPTETRREKLIARLRDQKAVASAQLEGQTHKVRRRASQVDESTGEKQTVWVDKPLRGWYWLAQTGKIHFPVKYGSKALELAKGKTAIAVADLSELPQAIDSLIEAVSAGELDKAIESLLAQRRK